MRIKKSGAGSSATKPSGDDGDFQKARYEQKLRVFGSRVQSLRKSAGLAGRELAEMCGLGHPYIVSIESGTQNVTLHTVFALAEALGVDEATLLADDTPNKRPVDAFVVKIIAEIGKMNRQLEMRRDMAGAIIDQLKEYLERSDL